MNGNSGALSFDAYIETDKFKRDLRQMEIGVKGLTRTTKSEADKVDSIFQNLGRNASVAFAAIGLSQLPAQIVRVRGEFQQLEISFNTMLGSKARAEKLMAEVTQFAALTPYGLKDTAEASKMLLAYGSSADEVVGTLRRLGDIASGIGAPLKDIAYLYGTTMTQGRLYTQDLNQFLGRGIPMIQELAKIFNVAENEVKGLVEAGKVGFPEVQKVIENLTNSGSMFGGLMEAQSKSLVGLQAQLGDAVDAMLNDIGKSQEGTLSAIFKTAIAATENYQRVIDILRVAIATYGAYRTALLLTAAAQAAPALIGQVKLWYDLARSVNSAKDAQILFNLASRANPYVLVATALTALVTGYMVFNREATQAEKIQQSLNDAMKRGEDAAASEQAKIQVLTTTINNESVSRYERNKALQELIRLSPDHLNALTLENLKTADGVTAINNYIEAKKKQLELKEIESQLDASIKRQNEGKRNEQGLSFWERIALSASASAGDSDYSKTAASERRRINNEIVKSEDEVQAKLRERITALTGVDAATNKNAETTKSAIRKTVQWYDEEIKALRDRQGKASTKSEFDQIEKEIKALEAQRAAITGVKSKSSAAKAAKEEKGIKIKTFAEEIEEKKRMYGLYERWVQHVGKEAADAQFKDLISNNADYLSYVETEIKRLEQMRDVGYLGDLRTDDKRDLDTLIGERNRLTGKETGIDQFKKDLDAAKDSAESLVEYLQYLEAVQRGLEGDNSILGSEKKLATATEKLSTEKALKEDLQAFLQEVAGSEERRAAITAKYAQKRAALESLYQEGKVRDHKKALAAIDAAEKKEVQEDEEEIRKKSGEYKALLKIAEKHQEDLTKLDVEAARENFKRLTKGLDKESQEYKEHYENLLNIEKSFQQKRVEALYAIGDVAVQIGDVMRGLDGDIGNVGSVISTIGSQVIAVAQTIEKLDKSSKSGGGDGKFNIQDITSIVSLITQLVGVIFSHVNKMGEELLGYVKGSIALYQDRQLISNQQIGANYSDNPFLTDYSGMIKAGVDQYEDALKQYNAAISKLNDGNAITGYRGEWWRKKSNRFITDDLLDTYPELVDEAGNLNKQLAQTLINTNMVDENTKMLLESAIAWSDQMEAANDQFMNAIVDMTGMIGNDLADAMVTAFKAGEDGAKAMGNVLGGVIENFVKQTVLLEIFRPILDEFNQGVKDSYAPGGDGTIVDDIAKMNGKMPSAYAIGEEIMRQLQQFGRENGMPIFESSNSGGGSEASTRGSIQGMSEETASIIAGQTNAIRIYQADMANNMRISVFHLSTIAANTSFNHHLTRLEGMHEELRLIKSALSGGRSNGL